MLRQLAYLTVTNAFAMLRLLPMSDRDKDAEILALRHQITVLEHHLGNHRVQFTPKDRAFLVALLHRLPPALGWESLARASAINESVGHGSGTGMLAAPEAARLAGGGSSRLRCSGFCLAGSVVELVVLEKRRDTGLERVGSADLAQLGWNLPVIQGGIVTAVAADDLVRGGVVFGVTGARTGWLAGAAG